MIPFFFGNDSLTTASPSTYIRKTTFSERNNPLRPISSDGKTSAARIANTSPATFNHSQNVLSLRHRCRRSRRRLPRTFRSLDPSLIPQTPFMQSASAPRGRKKANSECQGRAGLVAWRRSRGGVGAMGKAFYKGGFEPKMTKKEASLILSLK